jgi:hypothetical protein
MIMSFFETGMQPGHIMILTIAKHIIIDHRRESKVIMLIQSRGSESVHALGGGLTCA